MILSCQNIYKSFADTPILSDISFHLEDHDKAALVGANGAGKSTLLKIITGELPADSGLISLARGRQLGYLAQHQSISGDETIYDEVRKAKQDLFDLERQIRDLEVRMTSASGSDLTLLMDQYTKARHSYERENGYASESEITGVLKGLGFEEADFSRKLSSLSGGQKTRIVLGKLLLNRPDILLLDEPTNHLDLESINWLETYLSNYRGAVLIVSHDRYFLDRIVNKVIELEGGRAVCYSGNYSAFHEKKAAVRSAAIRAYLNQQAEIRRQEEVISRLKSYNREKSVKRAESREKLLERMDILDKPAEFQSDIRMQLTPRIESGNDVLEVEGLGKSYGSLPLFASQSFSVTRGDRLAVIGSNGSGKTTLLRILTGQEKPSEGSYRFGTNVHIGYYDQEQQLLHDDKTIFEEIRDSYPDMTNTEIRNVLAAFLFTGDDVYKQVRSLSGGERGRVSLARLMLSEANLLILDEPTNHLDISSKEILEEALRNYRGTVLYVSHDRYFINRTATRILDLTHHQFIPYEGNYDYYMEKREEVTDRLLQKDLLPSPAYEAREEGRSQKADWLAEKEAQARRRKSQHELKKIETEIALLETRNKEIDQEFLRPETGTDLPLCQALSREQEENEVRLEELYEKWEELADT